MVYAYSMTYAGSAALRVLFDNLVASVIVFLLSWACCFFLYTIMWMFTSEMAVGYDYFYHVCKEEEKKRESNQIGDG